jgi:cysteine synthase
MSKIIKSINKANRKNAVKRFHELKITLPTFKQLANPSSIPKPIQEHLKKIDLNDTNPLNLFRITWKNDIKTGLFGKVNFIEVPQALTGVKAHIFALVGKHFPTGAHKVGAAYGCLVPKIISGEFDPINNKAIWPSTGNYCRGGAFDCALMGCTAVAVLPEGMSQERFDWLKNIGSEIIRTPGTESNVKEIYDECKRLEKDKKNVILNQFAEFGNPMFHYNVTGEAILEAFATEIAKNNKKARLSAFISATGSAGTIAAGDLLKKHYPHLKIVAVEALQCPTMLLNGFGEHRIEGIGDKHIPWIHNVRNTDAVSAVDDKDCYRIIRLFNEPAGVEFLKNLNISANKMKDLSLLGISGVCNLLSAIKTAKYFEMDENDVIFTVFTDSIDMYGSRLEEVAEQKGHYSITEAAADFSACLQHQEIDHYKELSYYDRKRIHNLKYYTWIEQQGKTSEELNELWNPEFWRSILEDEVAYVDEMITEFNEEVKKT